MELVRAADLVAGPRAKYYLELQSPKVGLLRLDNNRSICSNSTDSLHGRESQQNNPRVAHVELDILSD